MAYVDVSAKSGDGSKPTQGEALNVEGRGISM